MSLVLAAEPGARSAVLDTAVHPELGPAAEARISGRPAVSLDDVRTMRRFLAGWDGDLRSLLDPGDGRSPRMTP